MSKPAEPIERPGMGGYFAYLYPAAPVGDEQQDIEQNEGGEQSSAPTAEAGTNSSTSSSSTETSTAHGRTSRPKPARTTANR